MLSSWLLLMASYGLVKSGPVVEAEGLWLETGPIYCWLLLGGFISGAYAIFVKSKDISHGLCNKVIEHLIFVCVCFFTIPPFASPGWCFNARYQAAQAAQPPILWLPSTICGIPLHFANQLAVGYRLRSLSSLLICNHHWTCLDVQMAAGNVLVDHASEVRSSDLAKRGPNRLEK